MSVIKASSLLAPCWSKPGQASTFRMLSRACWNDDSLTACAALTGDLSLVPSVHTGSSQPPATLAPRDLMFSSDFHGCGVCICVLKRLVRHKMAQWVKVLAILPEDRGLIPELPWQLKIVTPAPPHPTRSYDVDSSGTARTCCRHTCRKTTHTYTMGWRSLVEAHIIK